MGEAQVRRRGSGAPREGETAVRAGQDAVAEGADQATELPNPLTLQAVSTVFRRRWAMPMTIAVLCLAAHTFGFFDDPNAPPGEDSSKFDFLDKLAKPVHYGKYGIAGGALFGSIMWVLVVALSDKAEGKPSGPAEHWAQNDAMLGAVLVSMSMATGGICAFAATAVWDITSQNLMQPPVA